MSSQRGNCAKTGPQKHQNTTAYRNDLHRKKDKTMKILNSLQITGCCKRCKEVIEWKIKYNKYKPLTRPKKCVKCLQKSVTNSYFIICQNCIESRNLCGKCASVPPAELPAESSNAATSDVNTKSSITSAKRKPEEEDDDSDYDEDDSDLDDEVEKALTINDKTENQVSIKPNRVEKKDGVKSKNADRPKTSDKHKVTFEASDSELDSEGEQVGSSSEDENEDDGDKKSEDTDKLNEGKNKSDEGREKLVEGKERLNEGREKLVEGKERLNEDEDKLKEDEDQADRNKLSTDVKKSEDDHSKLDEDESDGEDDDEEDDGDEEEDEDAN